MVDLRKIATEQRNPRTTHIDELSTLEMVKLINSEDHKVAEAVEAVCPQIAKAVDVIAEKLREGGRLIYVGCGTSGRLGILDAVECPPTYSTEPEMVQGYMSPRELARLIQRLEREMREAARELEFEKAADLRDRIQSLRNRLLITETGEEAMLSGG